MSFEYLSHLARLGTADIHPGGSPASSAMLDALALSHGLDGAEIGCGTGTTLLRVARAADIRLTGFDMLPKMLAQARRRIAKSGLGDRIELVRGHTTCLPFADESFDRVYCESVIAFHRDEILRRTLGEIRRVLRPGGRFACNEAIWKPDVDHALAARINDSCIRDFGLAQVTEHAWHADDWRHEFAAAGLRVTGDALLGASSARRGSPVTREASATWFARLHPAALAGHLKYLRLLARLPAAVDARRGAAVRRGAGLRWPRRRCRSRRWPASRRNSMPRSPVRRRPATGGRASRPYRRWPSVMRISPGSLAHPRRPACRPAASRRSAGSHGRSSYWACRAAAHRFCRIC